MDSLGENEINIRLIPFFSEYVVAESVVVIKKLIQQSNEHREVIAQMAKLLDFITVAAARAAIIWLIGEYNQRVPTIAPDVLRKVAKSFADESNIVKLQVLNLAVKLYLTNPEQTELLCQYVFNLAKYDANYDIRDRARFLRHFVFPENGKETILSRNAKKIFLATKPAPALVSKHCGREQYQLGSLSHLLNIRANGYRDLPSFPAVAPDPTLRNIEVPIQEQNSRRAEPLLVQETSMVKENKAVGSKAHKSGFYSESEKEYTEDSEPSSSSSSSGSDSSSASSSSDGESSDDGEKKVARKTMKKSVDSVSNNNKKDLKNGESNSSSSSSVGTSDNDDSSSDESSSGATSSASDVGNNAKQKAEKKNRPTASNASNNKSNLDLLLDLGGPAESDSSVMTPSLGGFLSPMTTSAQMELMPARFIPTEVHELLNKASCYGLEATYRFTRSPNLFSPKMTSIEVVFTNHNANSDIENIQVGQKIMPSGMQMKEFSAISALAPKATLTTCLGIDFSDSCQAVSFDITTSLGSCRVSLKAPVGELMRAVSCSESLFRSERNKLRGMTEHSLKVAARPVEDVSKRIFELANVAQIASSEAGVYQFAGQTLNSKSLVLITAIVLESGDIQITVNCEKIVVGSILLNDIKSAL